MPYQRNVQPQLSIFDLIGKQGIVPATQGNVNQPTQQSVTQQPQQSRMPSMLDLAGQVQKLSGTEFPWMTPPITTPALGAADPFAIAAGGTAPVDAGMVGVASADPFLAATGGLGAPIDVGIAGSAAADPFLAATTGSSLGLGGGGLFSSFGGGIGAGLAANPWILPAVAGIGILGSIKDWW
jgi:hypothetical protein